MRLRLAASLLAFAAVGLLGPASAVGQAQDTAALVTTDSLPDPDAEGNCTLTFEPIDPDTRALMERDGPETHITYLSGRYLWTCGTATMEADSAVKYDSYRRVELFGNVVYQDSIRTLRSQLLEYFEIEDLVIAREDVELVRLVDESRLTGPYVEFLRAVSGVDELTTATGRPHMTFYPEGDEPQEPFEIDADRAVFAGENEARFFGDVVIDRSDLSAEADSAYLTRDDGLGVMWGDPWVEAEEVRLEGDTIRFYSEDEELKEVHAQGSGYASGEQFEVRADIIDIELENEEVERLWAHGEGTSEALSGAHLLYGDSLRFALHQSTIDTVFSVGEAVAIQGDSTAAESGLTAVPSVDDVAPDASDSAGVAVGDSMAAPASGDSLAVGTEEGLAVGDSLAAADPPTPPDSLRLEEALPPAEPDSGAVTGSQLMSDVLESAELPDDSTTVSEAPEGSPDDEPSGGGDAAPRGRGPRLAIDGSTNWVRGDTLIAIFERAGRPDSAAVDSASVMEPAAESELPVVLDPALPPTAAEEALGAAVELGATEPPPAEADSTADPVMERLIVIGNASSFYRQVRDTTATDRPSRNYMQGTRIRIEFLEGEPDTVFGENAIGVFLEPEESIQTEGPTPEITDPVEVMQDSAAASGDSTVVEPQGADVGPDSLRAEPDSVRADTTRRASGRVTSRSTLAVSSPRSIRLGSIRHPALRTRRSL